jgi:hypothetical protein
VATPNQMVVKIAELFDAPLPTVIQQDRALAAAGLRTVGGRGRGPAQMSPRDAAHLLLAVAGSRTVKDSHVPIRRHGQFMSWERSWKLPFMPVPQLTALSPDHTFTDGLTALIESATTGQLQAAASKATRSQVDLIGEYACPIKIEVTLAGPVPWSKIDIALIAWDETGARPRRGKQEAHTYSRSAHSGGLRFEPPIVYEESKSKLTYAYKFDHRTITEVGELLRS